MDETFCHEQHELIEKLLRPYRGKTATEDLKKEIYNILSQAKTKGTLKLPFKVAIRKDPSNTHRPQIEIILETKI